jgi:hypothetical protein
VSPQAGGSYKLNDSEEKRPPTIARPLEVLARYRDQK